MTCAYGEYLMDRKEMFFFTHLLGHLLIYSICIIAHEITILFRMVLLYLMEQYIKLPDVAESDGSPITIVIDEEYTQFTMWEAWDFDLQRKPCRLSLFWVSLLYTVLYPFFLTWWWRYTTLLHVWKKGFFFFSDSVILYSDRRKCDSD